MVAPELKQYSNNVGITKTCAVLGCEDSKNLEPEMFFGYGYSHVTKKLLLKIICKCKM